MQGTAFDIAMSNHDPVAFVAAAREAAARLQPFALPEAEYLAWRRQVTASQEIEAGEPGSVTIAPALSSLQWPSAYRSGPASGEERVGITPCIAAVAETGSVVLASGPQTPAGLNFLPETHIIMVYESQVVRYVDDVFPQLRQYTSMPRAINFVTGPSRTADIEQTLEIGAHGPRRMHVLLIAGRPELS
jgi:hypothetical protein